METPDESETEKRGKAVTAFILTSQDIREGGTIYEQPLINPSNVFPLDLEAKLFWRSKPDCSIWFVTRVPVALRVELSLFQVLGCFHFCGEGGGLGMPCAHALSFLIVPRPVPTGSATPDTDHTAYCCCCSYCILVQILLLPRRSR